jgi:hypothetical protein
MKSARGYGVEGVEGRAVGNGERLVSRARVGLARGARVIEPGRCPETVEMLRSGLRSRIRRSRGPAGCEARAATALGSG